MKKLNLNQVSILIIVLIGAIGLSSCTKFVADAVTAPGHEKSPVLKTPADFGMEYEEVSFMAMDSVNLSGWIVKSGPENSGNVIVFTHFGIECSRTGYTPKGKGMIKGYNKEIEFLNITKNLVDNGYTVLMYDLRNHGNSGEGTCGWVTGGVEEYKDVLAAVEFISTHPDYQNSQIGLLSYCMGANSTTYAYGIENGLQEYENIKALIAFQPLGNADFLEGFGFSEKRIRKANELNLERGGKDLYKTPIEQVKNITVPTMLVQAEEDPWTNMDFINEYYNELQVEKEMFWIKDIEKRLEAYGYFGHTPEKMLKFFDKYLKAN